jgi:hypothetical protein
MVDAAPIWDFSTPRSRARQGWKVFVSATPGNYDQIRRVTSEICQAVGLPFKCARDANVVERINFGTYGYTQVGKNIVIYIDDLDKVSLLSERLVEALGPYRNTCPEVPHAGKLRAGLPIFYRYGAFDGGRVMVAGKPVADDRTIVRPPGLTDADPFLAYACDETGAAISSILVRYPVFEVINQKGRGGVFRALDLDCSGYREVVIKTGIRRGGQLASGIDGWELLKREASFYRQIRLTDLRAHTPDLIGYVEDGDVNVMILEKIDGRTLRDKVASDEASISEVKGAYRVLRRFHALGFVVGDAKIDNVLSRAGTSYFLDFECARAACDPVLVNISTFFFTTAHQPTVQEKDRIDFLLSIVISRSDTRSRGAAPFDLDDFLRTFVPETEVQAWSLSELRTAVNFEVG